MKNSIPNNGEQHVQKFSFAQKTKWVVVILGTTENGVITQTGIFKENGATCTASKWKMFLGHCIYE